jgi:hypothetical protein
MPHPCRLVLPFAALAGTLLLHACSQAPPETATDSSLAAASPLPPAKRTAGTAADSLNGMQGHTFGEPLRNFHGLVLFSAEEELGVRMYTMPAGRERGWFGRHAKKFRTYYQFQDDRFAMFRAVTMDVGAHPSALREQALSLFGPGKGRKDLRGVLDWDGERVWAMYSEKLTSPAQCWLQVYSKPLRRVQQAKQRAQRRADNAGSTPQ